MIVVVVFGLMAGLAFYLGMYVYYRHVNVRQLKPARPTPMEIVNRHARDERMGEFRSPDPTTPGL